VLALLTRHAEYPGKRLWAIVRQDKGRKPWQLLINEPVATVEQAWEIVYASVTCRQKFRFDTSG